MIRYATVALATIAGVGLGIGAALAHDEAQPDQQDQSAAHAEHQAENHANDHAQADAEKPTTRPADDYPLAVCPVSGEKLGGMGQAIVKEIDGRTVKFCCPNCVKIFTENPKKYHRKMDKMIVEAQKEDYPLGYCVVSGEELGGMGQPINYVYRPANQLVRFCCEGCVDAFKKDPKPFLSKIDKAYKAQEKAQENAEKDAESA